MLVNLKLALFVVFANVFLLSGFSQVKPITGPETTPSAIREVQEAIRKVLDDSGRSFREGMVALKANRRAESGAAFDRSVETFLMSTLDIQRDKILQGCYNQLIETVYRIEFPSGNHPPQIRSLSATCGWKMERCRYEAGGRGGRYRENAQARSIHGRDDQYGLAQSSSSVGVDYRLQRAGL